MEMKVYNPHKGRLETIDAVFKDKNTTWFDNYVDDHDIYMITDFEGDLLGSEFGYDYPLRIYSVSRADIGYDHRKSKQLKGLYE